MHPDSNPPGPAWLERVQGPAEPGPGSRKEERGELFLRRALSTYEKVFGSQAPAVARILDRLADLSFHRGDFRNALSSQIRAVQILEESKDTPTDALASALMLLTDIYQGLGDSRKADEITKRVRKIVPENIQ